VIHDAAMMALVEAIAGIMFWFKLKYLHHSLSERICDSGNVVLFASGLCDFEQPLDVLWVVAIKLGF
jgi:hypothetical protein